MILHSCQALEKTDEIASFWTASQGIKPLGYTGRLDLLAARIGSVQNDHEAEYLFHVAASFAGEDRPRVLPLLKRLEDLDIRVFYDEKFQAELWGVNLVERLKEIYARQARYTLLFASENYIKPTKKWTKLEREAAQARALEQDEVYLLPIRIDDAVIPGLLPTVGYLDLRKHTVEEIAQSLVQKLATRRSAHADLQR